MERCNVILAFAESASQMEEIVYIIHDIRLIAVNSYYTSAITKSNSVGLVCIDPAFLYVSHLPRGRRKQDVLVITFDVIYRTARPVWLIISNVDVLLNYALYTPSLRLVRQIRNTCTLRRVLMRSARLSSDGWLPFGSFYFLFKCAVQSTALCQVIRRILDPACFQWAALGVASSALSDKEIISIYAQELHYSAQKLLLFYQNLTLTMFLFFKNSLRCTAPFFSFKWFQWDRSYIDCYLLAWCNIHGSDGPSHWLGYSGKWILIVLQGWARACARRHRPFFHSVTTVPGVSVPARSCAGSPTSFDIAPTKLTGIWQYFLTSFRLYTVFNPIFIFFAGRHSLFFATHLNSPLKRTVINQEGYLVTRRTRVKGATAPPSVFSVVQAGVPALHWPPQPLTYFYHISSFEIFQEHF